MPVPAPLRPAVARRSAVLALLAFAVVLSVGLRDARAATIGTTTAGSSWGCPPAGYKYGNPVAVAQGGFVTSIEALMKGSGAAAAQSFRTMVYAADRPGGAPGTLLAVSADRTVGPAAAPATVSFPLGTPLYLAAGSYYLMQQSGPTDAGGCIAEDVPSPSGLLNNYNLDAWADGPANPAGPVSTESKQYTLSATIELADTAGRTAPGGGYGCPGADFKYGSPVTLAQPATLTGIAAYMSGSGTAGSQLFRTMVYAADGPGGGPGTLLAVSATESLSGTAQPGYVRFPVSPGVALAAGTYFLMQQSGPAGATACLSQVSPSTTGALVSYNSDAFADGPSDPAGTASTQSGEYTLFAVLSAPAGPPADTTPPSISGSRSPAANGAGWNAGPVTITFSCSDGPGGSGVASVTAPVTLTANGAGQSATGTCTDHAGNSASATVDGISIDTAPPTLAFTGNAGHYRLDQQVEIACAAADSLSGLATSTCPGASGPAWSFGPGTPTLTATATDAAGNQATASSSFTVDVTAGGICAVASDFISGSGRYARLDRRGRALVDALGSGLCRALARSDGRHGHERGGRAATALAIAAVRQLERGGWLTDAQADTLESFVRER